MDYSILLVVIGLLLIAVGGGLFLRVASLMSRLDAACEAAHGANRKCDTTLRRLSEQLSQLSTDIREGDYY